MTEQKKPFLDEIEALGQDFKTDDGEFFVFEKHQWQEVKNLIAGRLKQQGRELIETRKANKRLASILKRHERRNDKP